MKLLIVEDNLSLAEATAELLHSLDSRSEVFGIITLVPDLQTALICLSDHDAVLCDGTFPVSHKSSLAMEKWDVVRQEANRRGMHFVLYSGSERALEGARESGIPALSKPARIEEIYAALTQNRVSPRSTRAGEPALMAESERLPEATCP